MIVRPVSCVLALSLLVLACRERDPSVDQGALRADPSALDVGSTYLGKQRLAELSVENTGRFVLPVTFTISGDGFTVVDAPAQLPPGATQLRIGFIPEVAGAAAGSLTVRAEGVPSLTVTLTGAGRPLPTCTPLTCHTARFDLASEACVDTPVEDGIACDAQNLCEENGVCRAGQCVGQARTCDDGNACTVDACNPLDGCVFLEAPPCPNSDPCKSVRCDATLGCVASNVRDGTFCAPDQGDCSSMKFCVAGSCSGEAKPPQGTICAEATPCLPAGRCDAAGSCTRPTTTPTVLAREWSSDTSLVFPAGGEGELHDFVLEPDGSLSLSGWFARPLFRANEASRIRSANAQARRCILWNARTLCLDYPWPSRQGKVALIDLASGQTLWEFDLVTARPDFAQLAGDGLLYLARISAMGSDRFAALFEAQPRATGPGNCRLYFLVYFDAFGKMLHARQVEDPLLQQCNHPHPYGFSSDVHGNIFIAFSPSLVDTAPLEPGTPTVVLSYDRTGAFRWKRDLSIRGGELAVANGFLYPEQGRSPLRADTGEPLEAVVLWGRAVATADTVIQAPPPLGPFDRVAALRGFSVSGHASKWSYAPPLSQFNAYEIRLADWQPRPEALRETAVFAFVDSVEGTELHAVRARDGKPLWVCPVDNPLGQAVDLFEIDDGHLALMRGAQECGRCDPPFAHSRASFDVHDLRALPRTSAWPSLFPASVPWPGTFGGPAHDGQELPLFEAAPGARRNASTAAPW